jgi:hypothetical protein
MNRADENRRVAALKQWENKTPEQREYWKKKLEAGRKRYEREYRKAKEFAESRGIVLKRKYGRKPMITRKKRKYTRHVNLEPVFKEPVNSEPVFKEPVNSEPVFKEPVNRVNRVVSTITTDDYLVSSRYPISVESNNGNILITVYKS